MNKNNKSSTSLEEVDELIDDYEGFFKSKWDDFGKKGALSVAKSALDKGEKTADELEKGDAPIKGKDVLDPLTLRCLGNREVSRW